MDKKLLGLVAIALLIGVGIGHSISWIQIQPEVADLKNQIATLNSLVRELNDSINGLLRIHEQPDQEYFFIQDSNFSIPLDRSVFWGVEAWNKNPDSICEIRNGALHLFYNGTIDYSYGNSGVFQGEHTDGRLTQQILVGSSPETAHSKEYVIFPKNIETGKFLLETKFRIIKMGFNRYPTVIHPDFSRVNLGITLMCAINNQPFSLEAQTLWLDVYFAGYCLNTTHIWNVAKNWNYSAYEEDIHAGYFVSEVNQEDFGEWVSLSVDLGDYIGKTLNLIRQVDIKTIRVYGFIVFVECLGAYAEVEYDYVNTVKQFVEG